MATTSTNNTILGGYEANLNALANTDRVAADKNTFLKLLVAQLTHQDPLNPAEDTEFIAQLAQFTSLEELQNINKGVESLNGSYLQQQTANAVGFIGAQISAKGNNVTIANIGNTEGLDEYTMPLYYTLPYDAADVRITIRNMNAAGAATGVVTSYSIGAKGAGSWAEAWNGRDVNGRAMADGNYIMEVTAFDAEGNQMVVETSSIGTVIGVEVQADGNHKLMLEDGRAVYMNDIQFVAALVNNGGGTGGDGAGGEDTSGEGAGGEGTSGEATGVEGTGGEGTGVEG